MERSLRQQDHTLNQETKESADSKTCEECGSNALVTDKNQRELVCENCGLVVETSNIDYGPEWRAYSHSEREDKSRVGAPVTNTMHDKGLTTQISWKNKDGYGQSLSSKKRTQMVRLRKWQERIRTKDSSERNLQLALTEINRMVSAMDLPHSVREVASVLYRQALSEDLIRGRSIEGVATSCLYTACRQEGIPRSLEEVSTISRIEQEELKRTYRYLLRELSLEMKPVDPKKYVPRFCSALELSEEVEVQARKIIDTTAEEGLLSGRSPTGYAAAAIYAASLLCNEKKTQREVADVAQVTEMTIRNRYQEQLEVLGIDK